VILADKSDVHRSRVRNKQMIQLDIHDRVNYAVTRSSLGVSPTRKQMRLGERRGGNGAAARTWPHDIDTGGRSLQAMPVITLSLKIDIDRSGHGLLRSSFHE
jgi:hypothetical protein